MISEMRVKRTLTVRAVGKFSGLFIVKSRSLTSLSGQEFKRYDDDVKKHAESVLKQSIIILDTISDDNYRLKLQSGSITSSSVGSHIRHSLDHFDRVINYKSCDIKMKTNPFFNETVNDPAKQDIVEVLKYDERGRNTKIEKNRLAAKEKCEMLIAGLKTLDFDQDIKVEFMSDPVTGKSLTDITLH
jgi:hypothetical protein